MRRNRDFIGPAGMGGMVSLWGASSLIQSVQYGSVLISGAADTTINAVNTANAVLYRMGCSSDGTTINEQYMSAFSVVTLTNSTTVHGAVVVGDYGVQNVQAFCVVEYVPGVVKSIQSGQLTQTGTGFPNVTSSTATITAVVVGKSQLFFNGAMNNFPGTGVGLSDYEAAEGRITLTNSTTVTGTSVSPQTGYSKYFRYVVVEFY